MMTGEPRGETTRKGAAPDWTWSRCDREVRDAEHVPEPDLYEGTTEDSIQEQIAAVN